VSKHIEIEYRDPATLKPNPWNSNYVSPENEAKLRKSIEKLGVYKPIICRQLADGTLEILGGQHRAQVAASTAMTIVPVVNLGVLSDKRAKEIGLADNGRYGTDDALKLSEILESIGVTEAVEFLPFEDRDLAAIFSASEIDLDDLSLPDEEEKDPVPEVRTGATHQMLVFKVALADVEELSSLVDSVVRAKGYDKGVDSKEAAGLALLDICKAARPHL
jgi:ParB family transcriptional regulator, chromosome partitioning protein